MDVLKDVPMDFFDELVGLMLEVPASHMSDNQDVISFCGSDLERTFLVAYVEGVSFDRLSKQVFFAVNFVDLPAGRNIFKKKTMDYLFSYSEDVPYKFKLFRDAFVTSCSREADVEMAVEIGAFIPFVAKNRNTSSQHFKKKLYTIFVQILQKQNPMLGIHRHRSANEMPSLPRKQKQLQIKSLVQRSQKLQRKQTRKKKLWMMMNCSVKLKKTMHLLQMKAKMKMRFFTTQMQLRWMLQILILILSIGK
jgi:hypothetical protein